MASLMALGGSMRFRRKPRPVPTYHGVGMALISGSTVIKTREQEQRVIDELLGRCPISR